MYSHGLGFMFPKNHRRSLIMSLNFFFIKKDLWWAYCFFCMGLGLDEQIALRNLFFENGLAQCRLKKLVASTKLQLPLRMLRVKFV